MMQFDLFGGAAVPPGAPPAAVAPPPVPQPRQALPPIPIPRRIPAWEALLARSPAAGDLTVFCGTLWTGVIIEVLSCPVHGRQWLNREGAIGAFPADSVHGRTVFVDPATLRAWHWKRALAPVGCAGTHAARFRFTDQAGSDHLILPFPFQEKAPAQ